MKRLFVTIALAVAGFRQLGELVGEPSSAFPHTFGCERKPRFARMFRPSDEATLDQSLEDAHHRLVCRAGEAGDVRRTDVAGQPFTAKPVHHLQHFVFRGEILTPVVISHLCAARESALPRAPNQRLD